jgi:HKD family nuclease
MKILTGVAILCRLRELLNECSAMDIAVAWATHWSGLDELRKSSLRVEKSKVRILVGINNYITSPKALESMNEFAELRIYGEAEGVLFHPKIYIFRMSDRMICWIGSANLTQKAFNENIEVVAEFEDVQSECQSLFENIWVSKDATEFADFDLDKYVRERLNRKTDPNWQLISNGEDDDQHDGSIQQKMIEPVNEAWVKYLYEMQNTGHRLQEWVNTLDAGVEFVGRDWEQDLNDHEIEIMFGQGPFMPFGNLARALNVYGNNFCGSSRHATKNRKAIGSAIGDLKRLKSFSSDIVTKAYENIKGIPGCGDALTTRLLVFTRPEWFVITNDKTFAGLRDRFHLPVNVNLRPKQYAKLIEKIQQQPWCRSQKPNNSEELKLWNYRVALLDPILYRDELGAVIEVV